MGNLFHRLMGQGHEPEIQEAERNREKVQKEDFLLRQIDEFKDKAKQLQELLLSKEEKVKELEALVAEREEKAGELQIILDERQSEADKLVSGVGVQIDAMIRKVDAQLRAVDETVNSEMDTLDERITEQITELNSTSRQQLAELNSTSRQQLAEMNKRMEQMTEAAGEKVRQQAEVLCHSVDGAAAKMDMVKDTVKEAVELARTEMTGQVFEMRKDLVEQTSAQIEEEKKKILDTLESTKQELSEKVHSENVKCYRNVQTLVEEMEKNMEKTEIGDDSMKNIKRYMAAMIGLAAVNLAGIVGILVFVSGLL